MTNKIAATKKRTIWDRDGRVCHYCEHPLVLDQVTADHVWPVVLGGVDANWNLVTACMPCNSSLGHRTDKCDCKFCARAQARSRFVVDSRPLRQGLRTRRLAPDRAGLGAAGGGRMTAPPGTPPTTSSTGRPADIRVENERPAYHHFHPLPEPNYGRFNRGIRWALLICVPIWLLIFAAGFLAARFLGGP